MALVCCHDEKGGMILITRMADDDGRLREYPLAWHLEDE